MDPIERSKPEASKPEPVKPGQAQKPSLADAIIAGKAAGKPKSGSKGASAFRGHEKLLFLILIGIEALLIILFVSGLVTSKKKNINLMLDLKKTQEEFSKKEESLSVKIEELNTAKRGLETKLQELNTANKEIEAKLSDATLLGEELRAQLAEVKEEKKEAYKRFMAELRKTELSLLAKLEKAQDENANLQNELFKLTMLTTVSGSAPAPAEKKEDVKQEADADVDLQDIIVEPKEGSLLEGNILKVDQDYGFIIFDLGRQHGIKPGWTAEIYREDLRISEAAINEVYPNISFGVLIKEKTVRRVRKGDRIVFKVPAG